MPGGKRLREVVELEPHPVAPARLEGHRVLVALPVREVEQPVADARGGPVGGDIGESRGDERHRPVDRQRELGDGWPQDLDPPGQGIGVEGEAAAVLEPLVRGEIRREAVGAPAARMEPERLRRPEREGHLGAGLGREAGGMEHVAAGA